jgi:PAS domain S-box-containing protein
MDVAPQSWGDAERRQLADLAALVMDELELRREASQRRAAEATLRAINENLSEGIFRSTPGGRILYANDAMAQCFGYDSPEALRQVSAASLYARPEERVHHRQRTQDDDAICIDEVQLRRADGSTFTGRVRATAIRDEAGHVAYYDGVVQDISEQKSTERALQRSAERWERLVEAHPEPIHVSIDGTIVYINPAGARVYGADDPAEVVGTSVFDLAATDVDQDAAQRRAEQLYDERQSVPPREYTIRRLDGATRVIEVRSVPIEYQGQAAAQTIVRDVTAQRRLEEQLEVKQHQFRQLLDNAQPVVFVLDADGTFLVSEGRDLRTMGLEPGEVVGQSVHALFGDSPDVIDSVDRALSGETISEVIEVAGRTFDVWYAPILSRENAPIGCIGMAADITERRRAEAALREERDVLASIFNTSAAAITVLNPDGHIVKANARAEEVLGLSASALVGRSYDAPGWEHEAVDGGPFPDEEQPFVRVMRTGAPVYDVQHAIRWPNGRRKVLSINGAPIRDAEGTITGAVFVVDDITKQRQQRQQLRESQLRYRTLVDHFPNGAVFLFNDDLRYVLAGGSELGALCGSAEAIEGKRPREVFPPAVAEETEAHYRAALHGTAATFEQEWGEQHYRIRTLPLRDEQGTLQAGMAVMEDITEDVQVEAMLRQAKQKAEEAARLKSAMLANMSHEVRTPLTSIIGFAEMLQAGTIEQPERFATLIFQSGQRLLTTLDSVLHLSRLEAGTQTLEHRPVDLHALALEIVNSEALQAEAEGIALTLRQEGPPAEVHADEGALQSILMNLVTNAIKYTEAGGDVEVRLAAGAASAMIEVSDTGIGMDPAFQARMFRAFTQESEGQGRRHEGSGLGLAIVKKLTDLLGGSIEVESTPHLGTRMAVFIPRAEVSADAAASPERAPSSSRTLLPAP